MSCRASIARPTMQRARCPHQGRPCPEVVSSECVPSAVTPRCPQCGKLVISEATYSEADAILDQVDDLALELKRRKV